MFPQEGPGVGEGLLTAGEEEGEQQRRGARCAQGTRGTDSLRVSLSRSPQPIPVKDTTGSVGCGRSLSPYKII